ARIWQSGPSSPSRGRGVRVEQGESELNRPNPGGSVLAIRAERGTWLGFSNPSRAGNLARI
ncbi:hypothetical protein QUF72_23185, partial [Desulfobacterales bacterium HSG2]|nr:hypothetical protein [Desulfobacterales bacterium HSG2]